MIVESVGLGLPVRHLVDAVFGGRGVAALATPNRRDLVECSSFRLWHVDEGEDEEEEEECREGKEGVVAQTFLLTATRQHAS